MSYDIFESAGSDPEKINVSSIVKPLS